MPRKKRVHLPYHAFSLNAKCRPHFLDGGGLEAMLELSKIGEGTISGYCTATFVCLDRV